MNCGLDGTITYDAQVRASPGSPAARRSRTNSRRLFCVTAAHNHDDLHHLVDRLSPRQAEQLRGLVASDPELAAAARPERREAAYVHHRHLVVRPRRPRAAA